MSAYLKKKNFEQYFSAKKKKQYLTLCGTFAPTSRQSYIKSNIEKCYDYEYNS